jgi:hypothetical protein
MKRDLELQRSILLFVEKHAPPQGGLDKPLEFPGYDARTVRAHVQLLIEGDYLDGEVIEDIIKLTNHGHDSIKAIQDDSIWSKVKSEAKEKGINLTLELAVTLAKHAIRAALGIS